MVVVVLVVVVGWQRCFPCLPGGGLRIASGHFINHVGGGGGGGGGAVRQSLAGCGATGTTGGRSSCLIVPFMPDNRGSSAGPKVGREQRKQRLYGGPARRPDNERVTKEVRLQGHVRSPPGEGTGSSSGEVNGFRKILLTPI
ncbi:hypothetical protein E2C01_074773 [Portunus trituberculatus]|uniref:Secreted protein n=1 Tax=Portunus trituberculatus TaxID=210409 RepID=A0A5B7I8W5_PORTR|nr:hypothetical protein [Portunus trituberculatus]